MVDEKRYVIPLRKEFIKSPRYKRVKRAVSAVRHYVSKHMKVQDVKIGTNLNLKLWARGSKKPPARVEVHAIKEDDYARVELLGFDFEKKVEKSKKEEHKHEEHKLEEKVQESKEELAKEGMVEEHKHASEKPAMEIRDAEAQQKIKRVTASRKDLGHNPAKEAKDSRKRTSTNKKKTG